MLVVDSSVWIDLFRGSNTQPTELLRRQRDPENIIVGDIVLMELLLGARDERHAAKIDAELSAFNISPMFNPAVARATAANYRKLRARGITIRKMNDLIIGTFCIENDHHLLHNDRDFEPMQSQLGLKCL